MMTFTRRRPRWQYHELHRVHERVAASEQLAGQEQNATAEYCRREHECVSSGAKARQEIEMTSAPASGAGGQRRRGMRMRMPSASCSRISIMSSAARISPQRRAARLLEDATARASALPGDGRAPMPMGMSSATKRGRGRLPAKHFNARPRYATLITLLIFAYAAAGTTFKAKMAFTALHCQGHVLAATMLLLTGQAPCWQLAKIATTFSMP